MRACIHRGSKQIGGSCVEIESQDKRLIIDLGLPLDAEENTPRYLPNVDGLDGSDPTSLGILISHPHLDHFGLLAHISTKIPVGMGSAARRILNAASPFMIDNWTISSQGWDYQSGVQINIGPFQITPFLIDHSAYDSYALLIESEGKRLFYSGDLRAHGRKAKLFEILIQNPPKGIDKLLIEGSSLGRLNYDEQFPTESDIEEKLTSIFTDTKGLALVHTSAQNIDRVVSILRACKRSGRKLVIDFYTAAVLEATGNVNIPQSSWSDVHLFIPQIQRVQIKNNAWFDLLKHHSQNRIFLEKIDEAPEKFTLLFRPLFQVDLAKLHNLSESVYVYSQWEGYWDQGAYEKTKDWMAKHSIPKVSIHTSGHASPGDLKRLVNAINPRKVVPIHTFFPEKYSELFSNVELHNDDEWWEV